MIELAKQRISKLPEQITEIPEWIRKQYDKINAPMGESEDIIGRRRALRLLLVGGAGLAIAAAIGYGNEQNTQKENPWKKLVKLGPDKIYYYSGTMTVGPEETLFSTPEEDPHRATVPISDHGTLKTQYAPVILSSSENSDPQIHSSVGVMTQNNGLLFAISKFAKIEGGSFKVARKTDQPDKFIDIETGAIITPQVVK